MGGESASSSSTAAAPTQLENSRELSAMNVDAPVPRRARSLWADEMDEEANRIGIRTPSPDIVYQARDRKPPKLQSKLADAADAPVFVPMMAHDFHPVPLPWQSQDPYEAYYGMPCGEAYYDPWQAEPRQGDGFDFCQGMVPSVGSLGHPYSCSAACKYATKAKVSKFCKDGADCTHCHLCVWSSTKYSRERRERRKTAFRLRRSSDAVALGSAGKHWADSRRPSDWSNDMESTAMGSTDSPLLSEAETPDA